MTLTGIHKEIEVGDPLGRRYTPDQVADRIVAYLASVALNPPPVVLEPSVGGGAFVRSFRRWWPAAKVIGVDIDPNAPGLELVDEAIVGDWLAVADRVIAEFAPRFIVGNPPFDDPRGGSPTRAQEHVHAMAAAITRVTHAALILPLAYLGTQAWTALRAKHRLYGLQPVYGRPWEVAREVAVYHWVFPIRERSSIVPHDLGVLLPALDAG